jgi:hypothetical protein
VQDVVGLYLNPPKGAVVLIASLQLLVEHFMERQQRRVRS